MAITPNLLDFNDFLTTTPVGFPGIVTALIERHDSRETVAGRNSIDVVLPSTTRSQI
jgi:hypothetical protein